MNQTFAVISLSLLAMINLAGCQEKTVTRSTPVATQETKEAIDPQQFPRVQAPAMPRSLDTPETTSSPARVSGAPDVQPILASPTNFPEQMSQTVQIRTMMDNYTTASSSISSETLDEIRSYCRSVNALAEADERLSKDQRENLETLAGKIEYQASQIVENAVQAPVERMLPSIKGQLSAIQEILTIPQTPQ